MQVSGQSDGAAERSAHVEREESDRPKDDRPCYVVELVGADGQAVRAWQTRMVEDPTALSLRITRLGS